MQNTSPSAWLIGDEGSTGEFRFKLTESEITLGRGSSCEIQIEDPLASRRHAVIRFHEGVFLIEDLGSSNGTYLNHRPVSSSQLVDGDLILIGNTVLRIKMEWDPDATVIQPRSSQETITSSRETIPQQGGAVGCQQCGRSNPTGGKFCSNCGAELPRLPTAFQRTETKFRQTRAAYSAGELTGEECHSALAKLMVQDDQGQYWMMGLESGEWYWYNGGEWTLRSPALVLPEKELAPQIPPPAAQVVEPGPGSPPSQRGRWGAGVLWLLCALLVGALGIYSVLELVSFITEPGESLGQLDPSGEVYDSSGPTIPQQNDASGQSSTPTETAAPYPSAQETGAGYRIRVYNPGTDASLAGFTSNAEYLLDRSGSEYRVYEGYFPAGTPGILIMGWCSIDQETLNENMAGIQMEGTFDGAPIPQNIWTQEDIQHEDMACRYFRVVVEDLSPGSHQFLWSTSYQNPVFDGWDSFPPGNYLREYTLEVEERYQFFDDFESSAGYWGEADREELRIWIEGGDLQIEIYQAGVGVWSRFNERSFEDFRFTVQAKSVSGNPGYYGIVFRQQDRDNFYFFQITDEGYFRLGKNVGESIDLIPWSPSDAIYIDGRSNKLEVSMEGDWIRAYINDQLVADLQDGSLQDGNLCLYAFTPEEVPAGQIIFQQAFIDAPQ
jgi:hypothetical protein